MKTKLQKILIGMSKFGIYVLIASQSLTMAMAGEVVAQRKMLDEMVIQLRLSEESNSLIEVFKLIEAKTDFHFAYSRSELKNKIINLEGKKWNMDGLLRAISVQAKVSFKRINEQIGVSLAGHSDILPKIEEKVVAQVLVKGKVNDENGEPLPGATVLEAGTQNGTITDIDGNFSLKVSENAVLKISFIGYQGKEVIVDGRTKINVTLQPDIESLQEVVVVGYGSVKKSDLTGAVSSIHQEYAETLPITSIDQAIQGRVSGVQVIQNSGSPGTGMTFNIRGGNSIASNQPLFVVDGYPIEASSGNLGYGADPQINSQPSYNPLANLNPNDIESIEILKDASSTAIYGSRGANGVVIITTKKGRSGKNNISFNVRTDVSQLREKLDVLNAKDYISFSNEAALNDGVDSVFTSDQIAELEGVNLDWQDQTYQTAISQDYQLAFTGGREKSNYAVIASFLDQEGIIKNSDFQRGGIRLNYGNEVSKAFKFKVNVAATKTKGNLALHSSRTGQRSGNIVTTALLSDPSRVARNAAGVIDDDLADNPLALLDLREDVTENTFVRANITTELALTDWLTLESNAGANENAGIRQVYMPKGTFLGDQLEGYAFRNQSSSFNFLIENYLKARKDFGTSSLNAVIGTSWQQYDRRVFASSASGFPNDNLTYESFQLAESPGTAQTRHREWFLSSYYARVNYSFRDRYLLTFTGRADGSSRLAEGYKWAFFPSGAIGWKLHEESFFNSSTVNMLKLRASYGVSGNQAVTPLQTQSLFTNDRTVIGGSIVNGYVLANLANKTLGWETTSQINIGLDLGVLTNRIKLEANYYRKLTEDLLVDVTIPATSGFPIYTDNSGIIKNEGVELDLNVVAVEGTFNWGFSGNASINRNEVLGLGNIDEDGALFGPNYLTAGSLLGQPIHTAEIGQSLGVFYGYKIDGIYQNKDAIESGPEAGTAQPGDYRFVDLNEDGVINGEDRTIIGSPYPDFIYGFTNDFSYKGFSLSIFVQGVVGNEILNLNRYRLDALSNDVNVSQEAYEGRWMGEGTSNIYPRASTSSFFKTRVSDFLVEDGSYFRLKNVTFAYDFSKFTDSWKWIQSARIYVSGTNLITITDYSGYDPEVSADPGSGITQGVDNGVYPQAKTYSVGVNVTF